MKSKVLFFVAMMLIAMPQNSEAQQSKRTKGTTKVTTKRTTPAKKTVKKTATSTTATVVLEGPATVDGQIAFLGIPVTEKKANAKSKLVAKGLIDRREGDADFIRLRGTVDGVKVRVNIQETANGRLSIAMYDEKTLPITKARTRFAALLSKVKAVYGEKGNFTINDDYQKEFQIKVPGAPGTVSVAMFNEDEMDGASDFYQVSFNIND